jgi:hypothetical protein
MIKSNYEYGGDGSNSVEVLKHSRHKSMANLDSFETVKFDSPGTNMNSSKKDNSRINSQLSVRFSKDIDGSDTKIDISELDVRLKKSIIINLLSKLI